MTISQAARYPGKCWVGIYAITASSETKLSITAGQAARKAFREVLGELREHNESQNKAKHHHRPSGAKGIQGSAG